MELRKITMYSALTRTETFAGCDRALLTMLGVLCANLILPAGFFAGNYLNVGVGVVLLWGGYRALVALNKYDPQARQVWGRANTYQAHYPAVSDYAAPRRELPRWR